LYFVIEIHFKSNWSKSAYYRVRSKFR